MSNIKETEDIVHYMAKQNPKTEYKTSSTVLTSSEETEKYLRSIWSEDIGFLEEFVVIFLNNASKVLGHYLVSRGGMTATLVDPKVVFIAALKSFACRIIIAHNHPSGSLKPSPADITLTGKIKGGGVLLEMPLLDHIIITPENGYYSFADEGIL